MVFYAFNLTDAILVSISWIMSVVLFALIEIRPKLNVLIYFFFGILLFIMVLNQVFGLLNFFEVTEMIGMNVMLGFLSRVLITGTWYILAHKVNMYPNLRRSFQILMIVCGIGLIKDLFYLFITFTNLVSMISPFVYILVYFGLIILQYALDVVSVVNYYRIRRGLLYLTQS